MSSSITGLNVVVDISHHNGNVNLAQAKADGILAVIHKATQGTTYTDPMYTINKQQALAAGLLWGAYHFGTGDDAQQQAQHFLSVVQPGPNDLLVLDFETNTGGTSMTLDQARQFVQIIRDQTGRWPGLYSGIYIKNLLGTNHDPLLANCWFWLSQYGPTAKVPPNWPTWTLWQYTDGSVGPQPHSVNGIGNCDRDTFNGGNSALMKLWGFEEVASAGSKPSAI